jgi:Uma2 family endonuclease
MMLWMAGGSRLGWLIDTRNRRVYVYRAGQPEPQLLEDPETLDGEDVLPGFVFPVRQYIFDLP